MNQPPNSKQNVSSDKTKIILVIIFLAILLLTLGILVGLVLRRNGFQLSMLTRRMPAISTVAPASIIPPTSVAPTIFIPTADCGTPTLLIGSNTFQIETIKPASDGSLPVPTDTSGIAYWVEGTDTNYVFVLSPSPQNLAVMQTVTVGSTAKATRSDCSSTTYSLSAPQQGTLDSTASSDQSTDGITIFFQTDSSGAGFVFNGELTEEEMIIFSTPEATGIQANIALLETTASDDDDVINVSVSIQDYGEAAFTLTESDVSLSQPDGVPLGMVSSKPRLPEVINPGETEAFDFTFSRPSSQTATLKIFTVEYDIEGY